jgi:predicted PurR-regulated permease PerM
VGEKVFSLWQDASIDLKQTIFKYKEQLTEYGRIFFRGIVGSISAIFQIMISLIIASFLLTIGGVGESIRKFFRKIAGKRGDDFATVAIVTVGSVVKGVLGVSIIVGLLHGLIFTLAGIPFAGLWTLLVFVFAILQIPALIVSLPIILYLFGEMDTNMAIVYTVALVIAGLSDNVLKPLLLAKGAPVPMLVIFIGVIGGFIFSGFIGLFTGAIVMSIGYKLFVGWINS